MITFTDFYDNEIYIHRADIIYIEKMCYEDCAYIYVIGDSIKISHETYDLIKQTLKEYYEN